MDEEAKERSKREKRRERDKERVGGVRNSVRRGKGKKTDKVKVKKERKDTSKESDETKKERVRDNRG